MLGLLEAYAKIMYTMLIVHYFTLLASDDVLESNVYFTNWLLSNSRSSGDSMFVYDEGLLYIDGHCKWRLRKAEVQV